MVAQVLTAAVLANLQVGISMQLRDIGGRNPTFSVQAIDVLAHDVFEMVTLSQFYKGHVSKGWVGFLNRNS